MDIKKVILMRNCGVYSVGSGSESGQGPLACIIKLIIYVSTYLLTYLHTPWCRVLIEELTGLQLVKKFPAFHGTRKFITALTSVRQLSLSWANTIQSIYPHPTSWRSILILSTHLRLGLPSIYVSTNFYNLYIRLHVSTHSSSGLHSRQSH